MLPLASFTPSMFGNVSMNLLRGAQRASAMRSMCTSAVRLSYEDTIKNVYVKKDSRVLVQGFTGKTVRRG